MQNRKIGGDFHTFQICRFAKVQKGHFFAFFCIFFFYLGACALSRSFDVVASSCATSLLKWAKTNWCTASVNRSGPEIPGIRNPMACADLRAPSSPGLSIDCVVAGAASIVWSGAPESEPAAPGLLLIALPLEGRMYSEARCPRVGAGGAGLVC